MCSSGEMRGAVKFGRSWAIHEYINRLIDGRITTGEFKNWRK